MTNRKRRKEPYIVLLAAALALTGCTAAKEPIAGETKQESQMVSPSTGAPTEIAKHNVLDTIHVLNASGKSVSADLTMDPVPDSYYKEPAQQGRIEKFYYTTRTYGLYGRKDEKIRKYAQVYLPYGYSSKKSYDIVYLMHGAGGSAQRFFGSSANPRNLKAIVDNMIHLGEIKPMIFVSLTYYPRNGQGRESDWDAEYTKNYYKELQNDVLPQVESHYSTYAKTTDEAGLIASRSHRIFGGYSMGAVTAYYQMAQSMRYFHTYIAMSGSLYWGPDAGTDEDFGGKYLEDAIKKQGYTADDFFVYAANGSKDFARDIVKLQIDSEKKRPDFFRFDDTDSQSQTVNCAYEVGEGEKHGGPHGSDRYLYNALPVLSKIVTE